jgi:hypothetical protein
MPFLKTVYSLDLEDILNIDLYQMMK